MTPDPREGLTKLIPVKLTDEECEVLDRVRQGAGFATPGEMLRWLWQRELKNAATILMTLRGHL